MKYMLFTLILVAVLLVPIRATVEQSSIIVGIDQAVAAFWPDEVVKLWNDFCDSIGINLPGCGSCGYC